MTTDDSREQAITSIERAWRTYCDEFGADRDDLRARLHFKGGYYAAKLAGTADTTEAEVAKLRAERQKLQADRKRWNEFDLKTVQRFESERDQARADLAALRDKVRALHRADGDGWCEACGLDYPCPTVAGDQP